MMSLKNFYTKFYHFISKLLEDQQLYSKKGEQDLANV